MAHVFDVGHIYSAGLAAEGNACHDLGKDRLPVQLGGEPAHDRLVSELTVRARQEQRPVLPVTLPRDPLVVLPLEHPDLEPVGSRHGSFLSAASWPVRASGGTCRALYADTRPSNHRRLP